MTVEFVSGDLFEDPTLDGLAHGCNCRGVMGAGIAVEFKRRFPEMFEVYRDRCAAGEFRPSDVLVVPGKPTVFCLATQPGFGDATLQNVKESVAEMLHLAGKLGVERIGIPRIGAGLGGLEWDDVKQVLIEVAHKEIGVHLVVFEHYVPAR